MPGTEQQAASIEGAPTETAGSTPGAGGQTKKVSGITLFASEGRAIPSSGWKDVPGKLKQVSVGKRDQVWGVNTDGLIRNFQNGTWETPPGTQIAGSITCVSVAEDGAVWAVNSDGNVYHRQGNTWTQTATDKLGEKLLQISAVSAKEVWGVSSDGDIYQWKDGSWNSVPGGEFSWVSAAADETVWGVGSDGKIFRRDKDKDPVWTPIPGGKLSKISVGSASKVYGVNEEGAIFRWTGRDWGKVDGVLGNVSVASDGTLWGVKSDEGVQYYLHAAPLVVSAPRLSEEALEQGGTAPYQFSVTNTAPGTVLTDLKLDLLYDKDLFKEITVTQELKNVPAELAYGRTVTLYGVELRASARTKPGSYGFYGVNARYTVKSTESVPVSSDSGGWMTFNVVGVL